MKTSILKSLVMALVALPFVFSCKKSSDNFDAAEQARQDSIIIQQYIADKELDAIGTGSGLYYVVNDSGVCEPIDTIGTCKHPNTGSYVTVHYKGYLTSGKVFDQTSGTPAKFFVSKVIRGWQEGIPLMRKGSKYTFIIPSGLAYGNTATGDIPANSVLVFDVELITYQ